MKKKQSLKFLLVVIFLLSIFHYGCAQVIIEKPDVNLNEILKNIKVPKFANNSVIISSEDAGAQSINKYINNKISECSKNGGGTVVLRKGEYFCNGPIVFSSNVNLQLEEGSRLIFSQNPEDYLPVVLVRWEGTEVYNYSPFIYAKDAENIAITGKGVIDGNGLAEKSFRDWKSLQRDDQNKLREMGRTAVPVENRIFGAGSYLRPQMIHFVNCKNILLEEITVTNGSFWLIQPTYCNNITIRNILVESRFINCDGVDIDSSSDILIENCKFNTGDDFVVIKSGRDQDGWRVNKPSKNIIIRNSTSEECLHGISFGSELSGGIENIYVENLIFKKIREYGLQFKSNLDRGGYIKNVVVKNIQIDAVETCISFTNQYHSYSGGKYPTLFENISIENLDCKNTNSVAISIIGLPDVPITNVELKNITIHKVGKNSKIANVKNMKWENVNF